MTVSEGKKIAVSAPVHAWLAARAGELSRQRGRQVTFSEVLEELQRLADQAGAQGTEDR